jgi:hypothetical protein
LASADDELKTCRRYGFDVDYIEAGWPGSNPSEAAHENAQRHRQLSLSR